MSLTCGNGANRAEARAIRSALTETGHWTAAERREAAAKARVTYIRFLRRGGFLLRVRGELREEETAFPIFLRLTFSRAAAARCTSRWASNASREKEYAADDAGESAAFVVRAAADLDFSVSIF